MCGSYHIISPHRKDFSFRWGGSLASACFLRYPRRQRPGGFDGPFQHRHHVSLVFDAASKLRRAQLEDARFVVEPIADDLLEDQPLDVVQGDVPDGNLENDPVLVGSHEGFLQQPTVGGGFEAQIVLGDAAFEEFHTRVLEFRGSQKRLALLDSVEDLLEG
eukprot:CAMPEP_0201196454 /NCGR_PEP_ID=MMETSP0851-20130426/152764_1 /ASSEMBLY_ACC=CAM_ASM_000631 /TAXON_ID=183588 /ORGANISM="Pseudo-nitzschia fraudulenta, Strain WWA7" /LENGTH=160 /DNA_ID=CAMNT_0047483411 /DNA_START=100 /DNA_END=582 /DNA_ORIENTATION=-